MRYQFFQTSARPSGKIGVWAGLLFLCASGSVSLAAAGILQMTNGYCWDPSTSEYFVPRGVAYQIWNPPVGANQSLDQVDYDLLEFKKMHANSVRVEMTWGQVEIGPDRYDWTKPDHLIKKAEELGLRLFVIIGYQYPPSWFPATSRGINAFGLRADVMQALANCTPANALGCLPSQLASNLQTNNSPDVLAQVLNCLVMGAKAGSVSNVLQCLQSTLTPEQFAVNLPCLISDVINYEDPAARAAYQGYISAVTARYKDNPAVGAWILGNEYAYFDLWESPTLYAAHRFLGYDPISQQGYRDFLRSIYQTNIAGLNANWLTSYANFDAVVMPLEYPANRYLPAYHDLIQWRKHSIGSFVALGAKAAKVADPNHLHTYSMVGGIFSGSDANFSCEDAKTIVGDCAAAGAPLDFWSINNYAWATIGNEMRSASFGIGKYHAQSGLPVMISETGHSSTEDLFDYDSTTGHSFSGARQAKALPSTLWESLLCGAMGVHFFNWNDRSQFTQAYFYRERGFGIVAETRVPKQPVYDNVSAMFRQMENIHLDRLLGGSSNPPPDIQYFWSTNADMVWPRANQENAMLWGALKRVGFQPGILDDQGFEQGGYTNAPALLLSRSVQMSPLHLQQLATKVLPAGIHIHAEADLPGQLDTYGRPNTNWVSLMQTIFGIDVSHAAAGFESPIARDCQTPIQLVGVTNLGTITTSFAVDFTTWKLWQNVLPLSAKVALTYNGFPGVNNRDCPYTDPNHYPALLVNSSGTGRGKTAVNPFALGDTYAWSGAAAGQWDTRYAVLHAIYRDYFGLKPVVDLSGPGASRVLATYRICSNGGVLISLLNADTNTATLTISAPTLLTGRKVEDLTFGGILTANSNGTLSYTNQGDDTVLLYAYPTDGQKDVSLVNSNPNKLWFDESPPAVWPAGAGATVRVGYDTKDSNLNLVVNLEQRLPHPGMVLGQSSPTNLSGAGTVTVVVPVPDADPNNPDYISSHAGAEYVFHAYLLKGGVPVADQALSTRLLFGVHPTQPFPHPIVAGQTYPITLAWEELPSPASGTATPLPLDRAALWDSSIAPAEHYNVVLELLSSVSSHILASSSYLTTQGTGSHLFSFPVSAGAVEPVTWIAYVQTATNVLSYNVNQSFEGYARGAQYDTVSGIFTNYNFFTPWEGYVYSSDPLTNIRQNMGVQLDGSEGSQSAFIVATNLARLAYAGFGMFYVFPADWALPADTNQWTNYVFSYDYRENHGYRSSVEMQIKNTDPNNLGEWLQYSQLYAPGSNVWMHFSATLDQFLPPPGLSGVFDPKQVHALALNVSMLDTNVQYVGAFDNIRFSGPEINQGGGQILTLYTSANDSAGLLTAERSPTGVAISWFGSGVLQVAPAVTGPWNNVTNATNPLLIAPAAKGQFYRLHN